MDKITCATCPHRIDEAPFFHWCGLETVRGEDVNVYVDVSDGNWKPFDFQPEWCLLEVNIDDNK